jgi:hypothetical protein
MTSWSVRTFRLFNLSIGAAYDYNLMLDTWNGVVIDGIAYFFCSEFVQEQDAVQYCWCSPFRLLSVYKTLQAVDSVDPRPTASRKRRVDIFLVSTHRAATASSNSSVHGCRARWSCARVDRARGAATRQRERRAGSEHRRRSGEPGDGRCLR